jgi:hypothetical protein
MYRFAISALAFFCSVGALGAQPPMGPMPSFDQQRQMQQAMSAPRASPLLKMRVFLKGGPQNPPLDSFRLSSGKILVWRFMKEDAFLFTGGAIEYRGDQIDSIVLENGKKGVPYGKWMTFLNQAGPINYYGLEPDTLGSMPFLIQKGSGEIVRPSPKNIRLMVEEDPEAGAWMSRYGHRFLWKSGVAAAGLGMFIGGVAWSQATQKTDADGRKGDGSMGGLILGLGGAAVFCVPFTALLDFIWADMPKKALDAYNRNGKSGP